jgi:glycosyltransferase involved in cell wall biosynthesis
MRLLFCCEFYYPSGGGVAEVMRQVAERMVLAGHDVTVATSHDARRKFESHNGVKIDGFKVEGNLVRGISGEAGRYREFVLGFAADAILIKAAQQWTFDALWPVLDGVTARKVFIPCGFSCLYEPAYSDYFIQLPQILRKFDHLIFYANEYRDIDFARAHGLTNISVLPNGASEVEFSALPDPAFRARLGIPEDDFVFFTVGSPISMKGHKAVAEAFAKIKLDGRSATLILNGNWPQSVHAGANVLRILRQQGLAGFYQHAPRRLRKWLVEPIAAWLRPHWYRIRHGAFLLGYTTGVLQQEGWAGFRRRLGRTVKQWRQRKGQSVCEQPAAQPPPAKTIDDWIKEARAQPGKRVVCTDLPRADVVQAFMTADLFVFASVVEYSPLVLFETAAAGTPFLSVPVGNAEEIARWTGGGVICPAPKDERGYTQVDPDVLAREMQRCMNEPQLLIRLGKNAKTAWLRQFTWQAIAPRYEAILGGMPQPEKLLKQKAR